MARLTNTLGLPESIVRAVANDPYDRGDAHISVTGLIGPARKRQLEMQHADKTETDVADRIWSLYGQVVHGILERADLDDDEIVTEQRLFIERHDWRISGQFDRLVLKDRHVLQDYKFTSVYTIKDGPKPEYEAQANLYALMLAEHGYRLDAAEIVAVLRDWSKTKARNSRKYGDPNYPQRPVAVLPVRLWSRDETETYIRARLMAHGLAQDVLPDCTAEERWADPPAFKIIKVGNKRAEPGHAAHPTRESAEAGLAALRDAKPKTDFQIVEVAGTSKRCADYCEAAPFCEQWRALNPNKLAL
jgi:hypothetical protein